VFCCRRQFTDGQFSMPLFSLSSGSLETDCSFSFASRFALLRGALLCLLVLGGLTGSAFAQSGGQVLYNGIVLPAQWPPSEAPTQIFQTPSYITNPPSVIPIDLGRQLFVDDFLIQQTTMTRTQHQAVMYPLNPIIAPGSVRVRRTIDALQRRSVV
jgi:hypothetical protein